MSGLLRMEQLPAFQAETYACAARLGRIIASAREPGYGLAPAEVEEVVQDPLYGTVAAMRLRSWINCECDGAGAKCRVYY